MGKGFPELLEILDKKHPIVIQTHNYPDHDAVASGFALLWLLRRKNIRAVLCYAGLIESWSLSEAIRQLEIPILRADEIEITPDSQIIIVDGFMGNRNMSDLPGNELAVIDHHQPPETPGCPFADIRPDYGSCSTILYTYIRDSDVEIDRNVATALLMGIMMDTGYLTRGVSLHDFEAYGKLFSAGDWDTGNKILNNSLSMSDLPVFRRGIESARIQGDMCFLYFCEEKTSEVMGLLADFFLRVREIHVVVIVYNKSGEVTLSVRSEDPKRPARKIIQRALRDIGSGGGHVHMGGGSIPLDKFPGDEALYKRFVEALEVK